MDEAEAIMALRSKVSSVQTSAAQRRARELRPVHFSDRRAMRGETKNAQLNLHVYPSFKARVLAAAQARRLPAVELIQLAFEAYLLQETRGGL